MPNESTSIMPILIRYSRLRRIAITGVICFAFGVGAGIAASTLFARITAPSDSTLHRVAKIEESVRESRNITRALTGELERSANQGRDAARGIEDARVTARNLGGVSADITGELERSRESLGAARKSANEINGILARIEEINREGHPASNVAGSGDRRGGDGPGGANSRHSDGGE